MSHSHVLSEQVDRLLDELVARLEPGLASAGEAVTFTQIELATHALGQQLASRLTTKILESDASEHAEFAACPKCRHSTRVTRKRRVVHTLDGPVDYLEPASHCVACRRDFFPSTSPSGSD